MLISELIGIWDLLIRSIDPIKRLWHWLRPKKKEPSQVKTEISVATRFVELFEHHGVHRNQIPRFFGHNLQPKDMVNDSSILAVLTEDMLEKASTLFAINREWLDGESTQIYPTHDFYKWPEDCQRFIETLAEQDKLHGVLLSPEYRDNASDEWAQAHLIIQESIGRIGNKTIYRYHLCNNWLFSYWKSRAYLTACIAIAWKNRCCVIGRKTGPDFINQFVDGKKFLEHDGEDALPTPGTPWYPEDMALLPDTFLADIDPEQNDFGIRSGLELWLKLYDAGFMDIGLGHKNVQKKFMDRLTKYQEQTGT